MQLWAFNPQARCFNSSIEDSKTLMFLHFTNSSSTNSSLSVTLKTVVTGAVVCRDPHHTKIQVVLGVMRRAKSHKIECHNATCSHLVRLGVNSAWWHSLWTAWQLFAWYLSHVKYAQNDFCDWWVKRASFCWNALARKEWQNWFVDLASKSASSNSVLGSWSFDGGYQGYQDI